MLEIESETLQSILIYIVSRLSYPQILTEIALIEEFTPEAVQLSSRCLYLVMIKAACEYLLEFKEEEFEERLDTMQN